MCGGGEYGSKRYSSPLLTNEGHCSHISPLALTPMWSLIVNRMIDIAVKSGFVVFHRRQAVSLEHFVAIGWVRESD